jgi:hypothetical protein
MLVGGAIHTPENNFQPVRRFEKILLRSSIIQLTEYYNGGDTGSKQNIISSRSSRVHRRLFKCCELKKIKKTFTVNDQQKLLLIVMAPSNVTVWQQLYKQ